MSSCGKIIAGFDFCSADAIVAGIDDALYIFNEEDFVITYDPNNPLIVTGITPINGAKMFRYEGTNNSFDTMSTGSQTTVGLRYLEEIDFNIAGNSSTIKAQIRAFGNHKTKCIAVNNYKSTDAAFELFGATTSLLASETKRQANDENLSGGYSIKLTNPNKLKEGYPPRCVSIAPSLFGAGTFYYKITALTALGETIPSSEGSVSVTSDITQIILSWPAIAGAVSYNVYRGSASNGENVSYNTVTNGYTDENLPGTAATPPGANTAGIAAPAIPTLSSSASGGTLAAGTYFYKIVAVNAAGTTLGSPEASITVTGSTSSVSLSWAAVQGAVSYRVYRGTSAGAEDHYQAAGSNSFTDTGSVGTVGTVPVSNTANLAAPSAPTATGSNSIPVTATYASTLAALDAMTAPNA
jgi:hypothetical protein